MVIKILVQALGPPSGALRNPLQYLPYAVLQKGLDIVQKPGLDKTYGYEIPRLANSA